MAGALLVAAGVAAFVDRAVLSQKGHARPDLQRILDSLVIGSDRVAPGVTAYVSGPRGTWIGSAGLANVKTGETMQPDLRMHLDSNSKAWTAVLILQLVGEAKMRLDDTVARWLPGLLPYGDRITVRELLNHTSGLVDDESDITSDRQRAIGQVRDPSLRSELLRLLRRELADPTVQAPAMLWVRFAAALPLRSVPGSTFHYSNLGYTILGLIASKVGGAPLQALYRRRIIEPLGLTSAVYQPQGEIGGPHPVTTASTWTASSSMPPAGIAAARAPASASLQTHPTRPTS